MANYQDATVLENRDQAIILEVNFNTDDYGAIIDAIGDFRARVNSYQTRYGSAGMGLTVAFGRDAWNKLSGNPKSAPELVDFHELGYGMAPATQRDMFVHILSNFHALNFSLALDFVHIFQGLVTVEDETHGFRWLEARDLGGFVDGTENPKGIDERVEVAIINEGIDTGGSYVIGQRWEHHLAQIHHFDLETQENIFGRSKTDDIEMSDDEKPIGAHTERVVIEENGEELSIVRQSLPYGKASGIHGLYFIAYSAELTRIEKMLARMFGDEDGVFDHMLSYTHAVTGSFFYAPSIDQLEALGE